jgi:uncharacterized caspase-like protein
VVGFLLLTGAVTGAAERGIGVRPVAPTGETVTGTQWLLTIGIDNYLNWPRLKTAVNDAQAVRDVLLEHYYFDREHVIELFNEQATRKNILAALRELAHKVGPDDSLLVFYAGHGQLDSITKAGSWVPVESGTDDSSAWITNQTIKDYLKADAIKAKHILLVSDSCFAGDFFRGSRGNLPEVTDVVVKKAYQRASRQAITSGGVEPVSDAGFGGNSVFSHFLVSALRDNDKSFLIPSDLFPEVKSGVAQNAEQFPQFGTLHGVGGQEGGEFVLFLRRTDRLQNLAAESEARQQKLERLKQMEDEALQQKQKEQAEIARKEADLARLDAQIVELNRKLGTAGSGSNSQDSLDTLLAMVKQKEEQAARLEALRRQREDEERKRLAEIERLKREQEDRRFEAITADVTKYEQIAGSPYGKELAGAAWASFVGKYPECNDLNPEEIRDCKKRLGIVDRNPAFNSSSLSSSGVKSPQQVSFKNKMGTVTLRHEQHAAKYKCHECHQADTWKMVMSKDVGHNLCKDCHKTSGGPTKCRDCHEWH